MNDFMKQRARSAIQALVDRAPWGVREALLEACIKRYGLEDLSLRLLPRFGIAEIGVMGGLGLIRSAWNDRQILETYARAGHFEQGIVGELLEFFGTEEGTYIDVGANIGLTTIPIARNPLVRCIAFEPEPTNFRSLQANVATNVSNNEVKLLQKAVFDRHATLSLAIAGDNLGDHRVTMEGVPGRQTVEVPAVPLDDLLDWVKGKLAVKIDTQGAEPSVVNGGRAVLAQAGLVAMEFCPFLMRQLGGDPAVVIDFVAGFDQIALMNPGSEDRPVFGSVADAVRNLQTKSQNALPTDDDYLDIVAKRSFKKS